MIETLARAPHKLRNAIRALHRSSERNARREFLVEGPHACQEFIAVGVIPTVVVVSDDANATCVELAQALFQRGAHVVACGSAEHERLCTTNSSQGIIMVVPFFEERPLGMSVVVLDAVSDPGNVGSIIRTALWFGCTDVVLGPDCVDVYNPKVVRSSAGALASINLVRTSDLVSLLKRYPTYDVIATLAEAGQAPSSLQPRGAWFLLIGSEAHGVSSAVRACSTMSITIPSRHHGVESLNASIAAAIVLYELRGRE